MAEEKPLKLRRGFGALSAERRREIARQGGRAVQEQGVGHQWDFEEAQAAGRKGGQAFSANNLQLKNLAKESTLVMAAFFVPWLVAPLWASHFFVVSIGKKEPDENAADPID